MNRCETCTHRTAHGDCTNPKIAEDEGQSDEQMQDMLVYQYNNGAIFTVGPKFGCVHHESKGQEGGGS